MSVPTANASPSVHVHPFEPGQARKLTSPTPAPASVGFDEVTDTVDPFLMKAPPAGALSVKTVGAVTSRVIVSPCTVFALRSVTVV